MPRTRKFRKPLAYVSIGPFTKLYSEDFFIRELAPLGMSRRGFRSFCAALSVPMLEVGNTRLVDQLSLSLALRAVLRIGKPDFIAPGSMTRIKGSKRPVTGRLNVKEFERSLAACISELLAVRFLPNEAPSEKTLVDAAKEAARRMKLAGFGNLSRVQQDRYTRAALSAAHEKGLFSNVCDPTA